MNRSGQGEPGAAMRSHAWRLLALAALLGVAAMSSGGASTPMLVRAARARLDVRPALRVDRTVIVPAEVVLLAGARFTRGVVVTVGMRTRRGGVAGNYGSMKVGRSGRFALRVLVGRYPDGAPLRPGTIVLVAHTASFSQQASVTLRVTGALTPRIVLDRTRVRVGGSVRVSGRGFRPGLRVTISLGGTHSSAVGRYGSALVDAAGQFTARAILATYPGGARMRPGAYALLAHLDWSSPLSESQKAVALIQVVP